MEEYSGKFQGNKKNGFGRLKDLGNNQIYEGTFLNDLKHGDDCSLKILGEKSYAITGLFKNSELISGDTLLPDGSYYEGEFSKLLPHGKGQMKYKNGNDYKGQFHYGLKDGFGRFYDNRDNSLYEGDFKKDLFNG